MQTAPVDESGTTTLAYIDSGPVEGSDTYTTLVCVHGVTYHAENFRRLGSVAANQDFRVIALNRRDYKGSTPFTPAELASLNDASEEHLISFIRARGLELARFLLFVINEFRIPTASADGLHGGLALLGWSLGNFFTIALLRHANSFDPEIVQALEPYLRTLILYDPATSLLGFPLPPGAYSPSTDPTIPANQKGLHFGLWIASFYAHPDASSRSFNISDLHLRDSQARTDKDPTSMRIPMKELRASVDTSVQTGSDTLLRAKSSISISWDLTKGALFDERVKEEVWPRLKVAHVYCLESVWVCVWGGWEMERIVKKMREEGINGRPVRVVPVDGANHFFHWEEPTRALKVFADCIRN